MAKEEAVLVAKDKANTDPRTGGLFKGSFKAGSRRDRLAPMYDLGEAAQRCPECHWELEGNFCMRCQITVGATGLSDSSDNNNSEDESDEDLARYVQDTDGPRCFSYLDKDNSEDELDEGPPIHNLGEAAQRCPGCHWELESNFWLSDYLDKNNPEDESDEGPARYSQDTDGLNVAGSSFVQADPKSMTMEHDRSNVSGATTTQPEQAATKGKAETNIESASTVFRRLLVYAGSRCLGGFSQLNNLRQTLRAEWTNDRLRQRDPA
ncbi:E3 ubiquitin ligase [Elasticomyces elasticus]|nr:E3 ubiquitin ligase [Elasticomyces elasticus]